MAIYETIYEIKVKAWTKRMIWFFLVWVFLGASKVGEGLSSEDTALKWATFALTMGLWLIPLIFMKDD